MDMETGSCSQSKRYSQFSKVILPQNLEDGTLEIPQEIVKEHGSYWSKFVILEVSVNNLWKVELKRCEGHVWLHKGWKDFVKSCSITCGYSLVFKYEGGSLFHVLIFDTSGLVIEFPVSFNQRAILDQSKVTKIKEEDSDDDSSIEILDDWPQKTREESASNKSSRGISASNARDRALQRAKTFQSPNPHFIVIMPPTCDSHLDILESSTRGYFQDTDEEGIYLNGPDGRAWFMKCSIEGQVRINSGWSEFAQEYHLRGGDVCIFELINRAFMAFNVTVFQITEEEREKEKEINRNDPIEIPDPNMHTRTQRRVERAESLQCSKPSFTVVHKVKPHNLYTLCVPYRHASRYLWDQDGKKVFLHGAAEQIWIVKCYVVTSNIRLTSGWKDFVVGNDLREGDTCVFELLSQPPDTPIHYNVTILRSAQSAAPN